MFEICEDCFYSENAKLPDSFKSFFDYSMGEFIDSPIKKREIEKKGKRRIVASCGYPVEEGLKVFSNSSRVEEIRKHLVELYMALFPYHQEIKKLAKKYGLRETRFKKENNYCILCGLCVRYCEEVKGESAIGFVGRGVDKKVTFIPESSYFNKCVDCMECMDICPTGVFPSNYGIERIPHVSDI